MVSLAARPPLAAASSSTGGLPARVTGHTRQNQSHTVINVPNAVARAPTTASARPSARTSAAPGAPAMTATERVRKSIDRSHERRSLEQRSQEQPQAEPLDKVAEDPLERLTADLTALSFQHAAAMAAAAVISSAVPAAVSSPSRAESASASPSVSIQTVPRGSRHSRASAADPSSSLSATAAGSFSSRASSGTVAVSAVSSSAGSTSENRRFEMGLGDTGLPAQLLALRDPVCPVALPPPGGLPASCPPLDNWKLDKLVLSLSANKATWRRSLLLYEWLKAAGHPLDDRLCTTLIRVCSDHGDAVSALAVYDWMTCATSAGGAGLAATAYTFTAAMRAALAGGLTDRALTIWNDAWRRHTAGRLQMDCRLCTTYLELCTRLGLTDQALAMYGAMRAAPAGSRMAPTVHAYTAAMRAATEGGRWYRALDIWSNMRSAGCEPTGHAYSAAISACAAAGDWGRAVALFDEMTGPAGIRPDVVSCTALITALAAGGEADRAEAVVGWMLANGVRPNARTYTALMSALGNAKRWGRAVEVLSRMQTPECGGVQPNAYTYSALLKSLGEHGQWQLAEAVFSSIERQVLGPAGSSAVPAAAALSLAAALAPSPSSRTTQTPALSPLAALLAQAAAVATFDALTTAANHSSPSFGFDFGSGTLSVAAMEVFPDLGPAPECHTAAAESPSPTPQRAVGDGMAPLVASTSSSSSSSPSPAQRTWTRPSQLHGLSLDLTSVSTTAGGAEDAPGTESGPSRRSFSLFSHPPATSPASAAAAAYPTSASIHSFAVCTPEMASSSGSSRTSLSLSGTTDPSAPLLTATTSVLVPDPGASSTTSISPDHPWSSTLNQVSGEALAGQLAAAKVTAGLPCSEIPMGPGSVCHAPGNGVPTMPIRPPSFPNLTSSSVADFASSSTAPPPASSPSSSSPIPAQQSFGSTQHPGGHSVSHYSHAGGSSPHSHSPHHGVLNEVVCGALMLAYERAGKWQEAVGVLLRALNLGITPNTVMYNTAISAAGKAGQLEVAEKLFGKVRQPDTVTHETMIAAYGMAGLPDRAEAVFTSMTSAGLRPRDFAFCGIIAAHSLAGNWEGAMRVRTRMRRAGVQPSVDVYNALLASCERAGQPDKALELLGAMRREGVEPNALTGQLLSLVGQQGVRSVENQQVAAAALSAAVAAYGTLLMQTGLF